MMEFILWGAAGHARVLRDMIEDQGDRLVALFDNDPAVSSPFQDVPVHHGMAGFRTWRTANPGPFQALAAIGGARGRDRLAIERELAEAGLAIPRIIHPTAWVARSASLAAGVQLLAHARVSSAATLGEAVIVNSGANVDHECIIERGCHLAPGVVLAGNVRIGEFTLVGPGAVILPRVHVGRDTIIGAGSVVTRDVPDGVVAWGNPARIRHSNQTS